MDKEILIIKHIDIEGPGTIEQFFNSATRQMKTVDLGRQERLPQSLEGIAAVFSLGGPMNVYEEKAYPFLREEDMFLKAALKKEIPVLGICLGAQLLAKACGAKVHKGHKGEIGWHKVSLTEYAKEDPLFKTLPDEMRVFQWHEDTFDIPPAGTVLASSQMCVNQAFRAGSNAYGLQFHIEVTPEMVDAWIKAYNKKNEDKFDYKQMLVEAYEMKEDLARIVRIICLNFSHIIKTRWQAHVYSGT